jgi:hypothetical protein
LPLATGVRILEARFYPGSKSAPNAVVVGRVLCEGRTARIEPVPVRPESVRPFDPTALIGKLEFIVAAAAGDVFDALVKVRSGFWSFAEARLTEAGSGT